MDNLLHSIQNITSLYAQSNYMEVSVIKIGNSKGIRLSKTILQEYEIKDTVELELKEDHIEIRPKRKPRQDWEVALKEMVNDENEEVMISDWDERKTINEVNSED